MHMNISPAQQKYIGAALRLCAVLGRKYGVEVQFGHHPATDGQRVMLPHWNLEDPQARTALYGCIAHEAGGHVVQTDFGALHMWIARMNGQPRQALLKTLWNICEDIRIEHNLFRHYPGARPYVDAALRLVLLRTPPACDPAQYWPLVVNWLLCAYRARWLGQSLLQERADLYGAALAGLVPDGVLPRAEAIGERILALGPALSEAPAVFDLAEALHALFDQARPSQQAPRGSAQESAAEPPAEAGSGPSEGAPSEGAPSEGTPSEGAPAAGSDPAPSGAGPQAGQTTQTPAQTKTPTPAPAPAPAPVCEDLPAQEAGDLFETVKALGRATEAPPFDLAHHGAGAGQALPEAARMDIAPHLPRARRLMGRLIPGLAPLLTGEVTRELPRPRGRRLDPGRLVRSRTDTRPAVFARRVVDEDQSLAFGLLVDRSSSTAGRVHEELTVAALGLGLALETFAGVDLFLGHFPGTIVRGNDPRSAILMTKGIDERLSGVRGHWPTASGGTPLDEATLAMALSFLASDKPRRLLWTLTDGRPNSVPRAREARRMAKALGVELYGIVLGTRNYPLDLFDDSESLQSVEDLALAVERLVLRIL